MLQSIQRTTSYLLFLNDIKRIGVKNYYDPQGIPQMFFDWFNTKEVATLGVNLANNLSAELSKANNKNPKKASAQSTKAMQKILGQLNQYQQQNKLNFLKKSKLANEFKWRLVEIGHHKDFADSATKELLLHMN